MVKLGSTGVYIIFLISAQNIDCGCPLEPPRRGGSNMYPQSMFLSRNKKNNVYTKELMMSSWYTCKPQFYYIKVGFKKKNTGMFSWWKRMSTEIEIIAETLSEGVEGWGVPSNPVLTQNLIFHYENKPISNILKILPPKNENFQIRNFDIFHIFAQNIDCWYSLEPPHWGSSNQHPQSYVFEQKYKKIYVYPCKLQFY